MRIRATVPWLLAGSLAGIPAGAQQQADAEPVPTGEIFGVETSRVLLDVVVRDKKDRPVKDLSADDFEVYEDGVLQQVDLFTVVGDPEADGAASEEAERSSEGESGTSIGEPDPDAVPEEPELTLIAFVFDRLSPNGHKNAREAALTYLENNRQPTDRVGVFAVDLSLRTLQPYTDDPAALRQAIEGAGSMVTTPYESSRAEQRGLMEKQEALSRAAAGAISGGPGGGGAAAAAGSASGAAAVEAMLNGIQMRMLRNVEVLERDQQGYASTNALLSVVSSLAPLPGRKSVVLFSEGLSIPPAVQSHFTAVISEANRSNVSIYTMDAAGLRTESATRETANEMMAAAKAQLQQRSSGRDVTTGAMMKDLERNEDLLRLNPHSGLGNLARDTGGFMISETNDLGEGFGRINDDMRFYYMLAYASSNAARDGSFREVEVKVRRPGLRVRARKGYYALDKQPQEAPVLPFEAPAVARLNHSRNADAFPARALGLSFPQPERPGLVPILVEIPSDGLRFERGDGETFKADFAVVVRIKDLTEQVVDRLSQSYQLSGPWEQLEEARAGEVLFYREAQLPPGTYQIEAVAYDALADSASIRRGRVDVPDASQDHLRMSSVVLVKRVEQLPEDDRDPDRPLAFEEILVYPNLGEPVSKAERQEAAFFFTVYAARGGAHTPKARLQVFQDGTKLAEAPTPLPEPDASGQIRHVCALPVGQFPAGDYELRVAVEDDRGSEMRSVSFTVAN
jgi:VWFA-related protein